MVGRKRKNTKREPNGRAQREQRYTAADALYPALGECMAIYVVEAGPATKIGISTSPRERSAHLQTGQYNETRLRRFIWLRAQDCRTLERAVHADLKKRGMHAHGEWFYISPENAIDFVERKLIALGMTGWEPALFERAA
jgi:hypothetical protein